MHLMFLIFLLLTIIGTMNLQSSQILHKIIIDFFLFFLKCSHSKHYKIFINHLMDFTLECSYSSIGLFKSRWKRKIINVNEKSI